MKCNDALHEITLQLICTLSRKHPFYRIISNKPAGSSPGCYRNFSIAFIHPLLPEALNLFHFNYICRKQQIMPNFSHIIFDLDGTLTNNTEGIRNSLKFALEQMQIDGYSEEILKHFIGPPLQWGFSNLFGLNERNTNLAVEHFRDYYSVTGLYENEPYPGISELLEELHFAGAKLFIATSKLEKYAQKIIEHFEFDRYIIQLKGADYGGKKATKAGMITELLNQNQIFPSKEIAMVGDTVFDMEGAKENELSAIAVGYGFGKEEDLRKTLPDFWAESVDDLIEILI